MLPNGERSVLRLQRQVVYVLALIIYFYGACCNVHYKLVAQASLNISINAIIN